MHPFRQCARLRTRFQSLGSTVIISQRNIARYVWPVMRRMTMLKEKQARAREIPEVPNPRWQYIEWNRDAELYAFNNRLSEKFDPELLRQAFTHRSYVEKEEQAQKDVGIEDPFLEVQDNRELIEEGREIIDMVTENYLSQVLPSAPQECIIALKKYLMSTSVLAKTSGGIGTKDLVLTTEHPVKEETLADTFCALISALKRSVDLEHAGVFVRDILIAQLGEKELAEIWVPEKPLETLNDILRREGRGDADPRIINTAGVNTEIPVYQIGIYSDKKLLGTGFGETTDEGITIASINSLMKMFGLQDSSRPLCFDQKISESTRVLSLEEWCGQKKIQQ